MKSWVSTVQRLATREGEVFLIAAGLVFAVATGAILVRGEMTAPVPERNEQYRIARYLVHGTGFVCPVGPERLDPSCWYAPGYIGIVAGCFALLGEDTAAARSVIRLLNVLALSVAAGLYVLIARKLFSARAGWITLALIVTSPLLASRVGEVWDTFFAVLGGAALLATAILAPPRRARGFLIMGAGCGVAALVNPVFTLCYPIWIVYAWRAGRRPAVRAGATPFLRASGAALLGFALVLLPWTVRNIQTFHSLFYLRGNLPLELRVANGPGSNAFFTSAGGRQTHPVFNEEEAARLVRLGEFGYFRECGREVAQWWRTDKSRFFHFGLRRVRAFWLGRLLHGGGSAAARWIYLLTGALALAGAGLALWRRRGRVLVATMLLYPLVYYVTLYLPRYRVPLELVLLVMSALVVDAALARLRPARQVESPGKEIGRRTPEGASSDEWTGTRTRRI